MKKTILNHLRASVSRLLARHGYTKAPSSYGGNIATGFSGFSNIGSTRHQLEAYQGHVYKCVTIIYRRAISVPMRLHRKTEDGSEEIKRHPFLDLMKKPNSLMTGADLKAMTFMHLDLTGKAFWLKIFNRLGRPAELWPLPVGNFEGLDLNQDETKILRFKFAKSGGEAVFYVPEEVVYFRYPHPLYPLEGASPVQSQAFAYDMDLALRIYTRNFFRNSARPDVVLETDQNIEEAIAKRVLMEWKQNHQGVERSWAPALLSNGLKVKEISVNAKDAEFAYLAGWTKTDILEAYNVPEGKLGTIKGEGENPFGIDVTFNSECIAPRLKTYEDQVTASVLSHYGENLFAKHANCIPRDREYDLREREVNLNTFSTTVNEERQKMGLPPVPWGETPWIPGTMGPLDKGKP